MPGSLCYGVPIVCQLLRTVSGSNLVPSHNCWPYGRIRVRCVGRLCALASVMSNVRPLLRYDRARLVKSYTSMRLVFAIRPQYLVRLRYANMSNVGKLSSVRCPQYAVLSTLSSVQRQRAASFYTVGQLVENSSTVSVGVQRRWIASFRCGTVQGGQGDSF